MPKVQNGLYRNANGRVWLYHFRFRGLVYKGSTGCESKTLAKDWLHEYRERLAGQEMGLVPKEVPTLRKTFELWASAKKGQVTDLHIVNMRCAVLTHAEAFLSKPLTDLDNRAVELIRSRYLTTKGTGYRPGQGEWEREHTAGGANTVIKMLHSLIGWAIEQHLIDEPPFSIKNLKAQGRVKAVLWPERVQDFLKLADSGRNPQSALAIRLMLGLGLREREALNAQWDWIDWRRRVFIVQESKDRDPREIPMPQWIFDELWPRYSASSMPIDGYILKAIEGGPHHKNYTQKPVSRCARALGIKGLTPHRLRATFATSHFEAGTPLSQIQQMMGHSDPQTTMGYIVQRPKDQAQAQDRVGVLMGFRSSHGVTLDQAKADKS